MTQRSEPGRPTFDVDRLIADPSIRVIVCCGAGGVGKTTTSAALGLRAAERGRRVVVLTIDPARRLAQSLGLGELDNTPRLVEGVAGGPGQGELHAMMLDMKRTFDEIVSAHTTPDRAEQIFANPFYQALSSSFAGTQEYMAMEKLGQLARRDEWDLIVVDTPPSRSALDFLDAPQRMARFLDGRMLRLLAGSARTGGRAYLKVLGAGLQLFARAMNKIVGAQLLHDLSSFVGALDTMFGGFRTRAKATYELLRKPGTAFVVVTAPENDALREASYFVERLSDEDMPLAGVVLNRVHRSTAADLTAAQAQAAANRLNGAAANSLAAAALRVHAERMIQIERERKLAGRFAGAHPAVPLWEVRALAQDVHDLDGLRDIGQALTDPAGQLWSPAKTSAGRPTGTGSAGAKAARVKAVGGR